MELIDLELLNGIYCEDDHYCMCCGKEFEKNDTAIEYDGDIFCDVECMKDYFVLENSFPNKKKK